MKHNLLKRLTKMILAGTMIVAMLGMNVSAAGGHVEGSHLESITFKATIAVENENVPTPEVTFKKKP